MLLGAFYSYAQSELTFPFMRNVFQTTYLNPAARSEHKISIGLPGMSSIYIQSISNGFVPNSVVTRISDTLRIDPNKLVDQLADQNMIFANVDVDLFHLKIRFYNTDLWLGVRQRHNFSFFYPKDLFALAVKGNSEMIGQKMDFGTLGFDLSLFREYTLGMSTEYDKWIFGGRVSLLQGLSNMYLKPNDLYATIEDDMFNHTFVGDAVVRTAGIPITYDRYGAISSLNTDLFSNTEWLTSYLKRFRNPGASISLGASYKFDSRTTFSLSFSDIGFINWNDSTLNYRVKDNGEAFFNGVDAIGDRLRGNEFNADSTLAEFLKNFDDEEFEGSYTTWLAPKMYVTASYQLARRTHLGFQFYGVMNRRFYPAFTMGFSQGIGRVFSLALTGSFNQRTITNLGFGLVIKPGPFQIYMLADNYFTPVVDPLSFSNLNFRFGVNLVFGKVRRQTGISYK
jgi:hypothetical protein